MSGVIVRPGHHPIMGRLSLHQPSFIIPTGRQRGVHLLAGSRVPGVRPRMVLEWARTLPEVGGNHVYWNGLIHIDTGPRRPW